MVDSSGPDRWAEANAAAVRDGLRRVLASDAFRAAPQLSAFLSFIVGCAIAGRGAELKGYTIAVEAFGRSPDFDPQSDPIVRVEAGRLRRTLAQYYAGEGAADPVRISIPVGAYIPVFEIGAARDIVADEAGAAPDAGDARAVAADPARSWRRATLGIVALLAGLGALAVWYPPGRMEQASLAGPVAPAASTDAAPEATASAASIRLPVIAVTFGEPPAEPRLEDIARRFTRLLVDAMARFDDLIMVTTPEPQVAADNADYVFEMNLSRSGETTEGFGRLRSVKDGRVVWTTSASRDLTDGGADPELGEIARRLATRLAEPFGIIHADFKQFSRSPAMRCLVDAMEVRRTMRPQDHLAARACLERLLDQDKTFHPAWSQLALLILAEYTSGLNPQPGPPLDRALGAALNAVRLAPSSARGQQVMMAVLFARGQIEDALKAGQQAMANNPYDPEIMADLGSRLVRLNRPAEGMPLLSRAIALSGGRPPWYDFFAFLAADMTGADRLAQTYAAVLATDETPLSLLGRAMRYADAGDRIGLGDVLGKLADAAPLFAVDRRLYLSRKGFVPAVIDHIVDGLNPAAADPGSPR